MDLAAKIHASPIRAVIAITGGGSGALERLLTTPGASATLLEGVVPYSLAALTEWLGGEPDQACSETTARRMARVAYSRARRLADDAYDKARDLVGVGCTASLASDRPKKGEHRVFVAAQSASRTLSLSLLLDKGARTRQEEEQVAAHSVIALLADMAGVRAIDLEKTPAGIQPSLKDFSAPAEWTELFLGERSRVALGRVPDVLGECVLLSGSFNPMHEGHEEIARVAAERTGRRVVLELSIRNADKPPLDFIEIEKRLVSLGGRPVVLTNAPIFVEKARLAPGCLFAVGADTMERIADPRFYADASDFNGVVEEVDRLGCRFLVFGRTRQGEFQTLDGLELPTRLRALCDWVPESAFRVDLSSTELRSLREGQGGSC